MKAFTFPVLALVAAACGQADAPPPEQAAPPLGFERASADPVRHGERIARILGCRGCHDDDLTGGAWSEDADEALIWTSNLRRAVPLYDDAALERAIRGGVARDGTPLWAMPSEIFTDLSAPDMAALIAICAPSRRPAKSIRVRSSDRRAPADRGRRMAIGPGRGSARTRARAGAGSRRR